MDARNVLPSPETVDVNVHPNKTDVRFTNNQVVYGAVYSVVSKVLDGTNEALDIVVDNPALAFDVFLNNGIEAKEASNSSSVGT